jgi:hypothetical protein
MKITILGKSVTVNGISKTLSDFDWSPYADVHAVQANLDRDRAEIEYREIDPDGDGPLPAVKPPNALVDAGTFVDRFGDVLRAWEAAPLFEGKKAHSRTQNGPGIKKPSEVEQRLAALEEKFNILIEEISKTRGPG